MVEPRQGIIHSQSFESSAARLMAGIALAIALSFSGGTALHAHPAPQNQPASQAAPEPPDLPEPPELPDPPDPSEPPQVYIFNDHSIHLGVALDDVTEKKALELKLPSIAGAIVTDVQKGSAAEKAGVQAGDVISDFDGVHVRSSAELRRLIRETPSGRTVEMKVIREGRSHTLSAKLEAVQNPSTFNYMFKRKSPGQPFFQPMTPPMAEHRATLGIQGDDLTPQLAKYFGVKQGSGVVVFEVTLGGPADKAGVKAGDVITQVDGKAVNGVEELRRALNENFSGETRKVKLTLVRDHRELTLTAELTRPQQDEYRTFLNINREPKAELGQLWDNV
jgi:C-terminal processing protease CtpA/Prc